MPIDLDEIARRDSILQYLAMYTATHGLMIQADVDTIHKRFVEFKMMLLRKECDLLWLCNSVTGKYGVPNAAMAPAEEINNEAKSYMLALHDFLTQKGAESYDPSRGPSKSKTAVDTLPHPTQSPFAGMQMFQLSPDGRVQPMKISSRLPAKQFKTPPRKLRKAKKK